MLKRVAFVALMAVVLPLTVIAGGKSNWIHIEVTEDNGETMVKAQFPVSMVEVALGIAAQYPTPIELIYAFLAEHLNGLDPAVDQALVHRGVKKG